MFIENVSGPNLQYNITEITLLKAVGKGKAVNFTVRTHSHITVNANGEVTAEFVKADVDCK